jgi:hypothetical protein
MHRSLDAAVAFYARVAEKRRDDVITFLRFVVFWATHRPPFKWANLPGFGDAEQCPVLPAFEPNDDLVSRGLEAPQAVWAVVTECVCVVAQAMDFENGKEGTAQILREAVLGTADIVSILDGLPGKMRGRFFAMLGCLSPPEGDVSWQNLAVAEIKCGGTGAEAALGCITAWGSLIENFPRLVVAVGNISERSDFEQLAKDLKMLRCVETREDFRSVIEDGDDQTKLVEVLKIYEEAAAVQAGALTPPSERVAVIANAAPSDICISGMRLRLTVDAVLRMYILRKRSIDPQDEIAQDFTRGWTERAKQLKNYIVRVYCCAEMHGMQGVQLQFLELVMTYLADLMSVHLLGDQDVFEELLYLLCQPLNGNLGQEVRELAFQVTAQVALTTALDGVMEEASGTLVRLILTQADTPQSVKRAKRLLDQLVQKQKSNQSVSWLENLLGEIWMAEGDEDDDEASRARRSLRGAISTAILSLRGGAQNRQ